MRSLADLRARLRPGSILRVTAMLKNGEAATVSQEDARPRRVAEVTQGSIKFEDGKFLPLGCLGVYSFIGDPNSFTVSIGSAVLTYDIAEGTA